MKRAHWLGLGLGALALIWIGCLAAGLRFWFPLTFTLIFGLVTVSAVAWFRLRALQSASRLEHALAAQGLASTANLRPDMAAEVEELSAEFQKAVLALKHSKLRGGGRDALYALPWYAIIGPPGVGKSTAIRNSGLHFPYLSRGKGGALQGAGGTRNCDWWLSNEAVLLDTAGRWATQDDDEEWGAFLALLKKYRRNHPINGVLVAVGADTLMAEHDEGLRRLAQRLRERLDEINAKLGTVAPVYVLLTKCDLVEGFVETFGVMPQSKRSELWGFTTSVTEAPEDMQALITQRLGELHSALAWHALSRAGEVRRVRERAKVLGFPQQFSVLQEAAAAFVAWLCQRDVFHGTPPLRGVYFSSGTQEGRPLRRLMQEMAEGFGIKDAVLEGDEQKEAEVGKSYFLPGLFGLLVNDKYLAVPAEQQVKRRRVLRFAAACGLLALGTAALALSFRSWSNNRSLIDGAERFVTTLFRNPSSRQPRELLEAMVGLGETQRSLDRNAEQGVPWSLGFGLYRGEAIRPSVQESYAGSVSMLVMTTVVPTLERELNAFAVSHRGQDPSNGPEERSLEAYARLYEQLQLYLRLTGPALGREPAPQLEERERLARRVRRLLGSLPREATAGLAPGAITQEVAGYIALVAKSPQLARKRDRALVRAVQRILRAAPREALALERIVQQYAAEDDELRLRDLIGSATSALSASHGVRRAFTRQAWEERVRAQVNEGAFLPLAWMLGEAGESSARPTRQAALGTASSEENEPLKQHYLDAYVREWQDFLSGLRVRAPADSVEALTTLQDLTRGSPTALQRLFQQVHWQTQLPVRKEQSAVKVAKHLVASATGETEGSAPNGAKAPPAALPSIPVETAVARPFRGWVEFGVALSGGNPSGGEGTLAIDVYQEQLAYVRDALQVYRDDPSSSEQLIARLQEARTRVRSLVEQQDTNWRPRFETLLWSAIDGASLSTGRAVATSVQRSWCSEVAAPYATGLAGRYPMAPRGYDVSLADFAAFYHPSEGTVAEFYDRVLSEHLLRQGQSFVFAKQLGRNFGSVYRDILPAFLAQASAVGNAFFAKGSASPELKMEVRIRPSASVALTRFAVGGAEIVYRNGPERWQRIVWPGKQPERGASLLVQGAEGTADGLQQSGEWGLFRLIQRGHIVRREEDPRRFTVLWQLQGRGADVTIDVRTERSVSPFALASTGRSPARSLIDVFRSGLAAPPPTIVQAEAEPCPI